MRVLRSALSLAPATTVFAVSYAGFMASALIPDRTVALALFYVFALPYYLIALLASMIALELGIASGMAVAVGLVVCSDVALNLMRAAARGSMR